MNKPNLSNASELAAGGRAGAQLWRGHAEIASVRRSDTQVSRNKPE
jgi:hypothetical protein